MRIRILDVAPQKVDVLIDDGTAHAVENHKVLSRKVLTTFLDDWLAFVTRVLAEKNAHPDDVGFDAEVTGRLQRYGATLQNLLFPAHWRINPGAALYFSVDAAWARLPFEILPCGRDSAEFAALKIPILRQIRTVKPSVAVKNAQHSARKFLLLANPEGAPDLAAVVAAEKNTLTEVFAKQGTVKTLGKLASSAQILEELVHSEYVHYSGHVRGEALQLKDATLGAADLAVLDLSHVRLAFINGCNSAARHNAESLAWAFLSTGVQNYIGYNHPVSDRGALFAADFLWRHLFSRRRIFFFLPEKEQAIATTSLALRQALFAKFGAAELSWLGIQFFIGDKVPVRKKLAQPLAVAAALIAAFAIPLVFFLQRGSTQDIALAKTPASVTSPKLEHERVVVRETIYKTINNNKEEPLTEQRENLARPTRENILSREGAASAQVLPAIESHELAQLVKQFRNAVHPYYTAEDKERILTNVLAQPVAESTKIIRLKNEMP